MLKLLLKVVLGPMTPYPPSKLVFPQYVYAGVIAADEIVQLVAS